MSHGAVSLPARRVSVFAWCSQALLLGLLAAPAAAEARVAGEDARWQAIFSDLDRERITPDTALALARDLSDPALQEVLQAERMAAPGADVPFPDRLAFLRSRPGWPQMPAWRAQIEATLPGNAPLAQRLAWYATHPPLSNVGAMDYVRALQAQGDGEKATHFAREWWQRATLGKTEQKDFLRAFSSLLRPQDHWARLDARLWDGRWSEAERMFPLVSVPQRLLAQARMALAQQTGSANTVLARVPENLQNDPGLLYERARWRRRQNLEDGALEILRNSPAHQVRPDLWWNELHIAARDAMARQDWALAYALTQRHQTKDGADYAEAEFLAGWLSLRHLGQPARAAQHFQKLLGAVSRPISIARGAYWLGRALAAAGQEQAARSAFGIAAQYPTIFYGQLAMSVLAPQQALPLPVDSPPEEERTHSFQNHGLIRAVKALHRIGQEARARRAFQAALEIAAHPADFTLLAGLATTLNEPEWAVLTGKQAHKENIVAPRAAWPLLPPAFQQQLPPQLDLALAHALIRQESAFKRDAVSPAGARGLMQMMPATAKNVAKKLAMNVSENELFDPTVNLRLGGYYIAQRLGDFDGSLVLALAAYNAGKGRVRTWLDIYGDPRTPGIDILDWIELIPFAETRNYVQRILENSQVYRALLTGPPPSTRLAQDLGLTSLPR